MKIKTLFLLSFLLMLAGSLEYLIHNEYIVVLLPEYGTLNTSSKKIHPLETSLYFWTNKDTYTCEKITLIPEKSASKNIHQIMRAWLNAQNYQEPPALSIKQTALSSDAKDLFIHFSKSPFDKNISTYKKLSWIQGLLKTIHMHTNKIEQVYFLIDNEPLKDYELDFTYAWPIEGFLE